MIQKIKINRVVIFELIHYMRERDHLLISEGELSAWLRERDREREIKTNFTKQLHVLMFYVRFHFFQSGGKRL